MYRYLRSLFTKLLKTRRRTDTMRRLLLALRQYLPWLRHGSNNSSLRRQTLVRLPRQYELCTVVVMFFWRRKGWLVSRNEFDMCLTGNERDTLRTDERVFILGLDILLLTVLAAHYRGPLNCSTGDRYTYNSNR